MLRIQLFYNILLFNKSNNKVFVFQVKKVFAIHNKYIESVLF